MTFTVAIVGRPNVGKSTLFNRLVGRRLAIVDDTPGVTRDRREGNGELAGLHFKVIDTAGLEDEDDATLEGRMRSQTEKALEAADVALFLVDARSGVTPLDRHFASWLRGRSKPVILVANKADADQNEAGTLEAYSLGLGEPVAISAEHNLGMADLYAALAPFDREGAEGKIEEVAPPGEVDSEDRAINLAIVGRPNVGKSTLVNQLLGEDRMLTGPEAGITRDAIATRWEHRGRPVMLIDTAGLRRKARVTEKLEGLSTADTIRTIRFAHVVVLVVDATAPLEKQDLTIARLVIEEGRCLIIAVNKWDLVEDRKSITRLIEDRMEASLAQGKGVPVVPLSALTGQGTAKLLPAVFRSYDIWNRRVSTSQLNRWLEGVEDQHPPPLARGRRVRLRYATQTKTRPPTFLIFASQPEGLPESYRRYLINSLQETFDLKGVPLRLEYRRGENPYAGKKS
jgi:GTP-binding protein